MRNKLPDPTNHPHDSILTHRIAFSSPEDIHWKTVAWSSSVGDEKKLSRSLSSISFETSSWKRWMVSSWNNPLVLTPLQQFHGWNISAVINTLIVKPVMISTDNIPGHELANVLLSVQTASLYMYVKSIQSHSYSFCTCYIIILTTHIVTFSATDH